MMLRFVRMMITSGYIMLALIVISITAWLGPLPYSAPPFPLFSTPTPPQRISKLYTKTVDVLVAPDATDEVIRETCIAAYRQQAQQEFGEDVLFQASSVTFQSRGGTFEHPQQWEQVGTEAGKIRYEATLTALIDYTP